MEHQRTAVEEVNGGQRKQRTGAAGSAEDFDLDSFATDLDRHANTRAAARFIIWHFSELRHELDMHDLKMAQQADTIAKLASRLAAVEKQPEPEPDAAPESRMEKKSERKPYRPLFQRLQK